MLRAVPTLAELVADPGRIEDAPIDALPGLRAELTRLDTLLQIRLMKLTTQNGHAPDRDRLLSAEEAATKLGVGIDYIYDHAKKFAFTVRLGEGKRQSVRFSERGIERYIRIRSGRNE